jgi:hypothetical protein
MEMRPLEKPAFRSRRSSFGGNVFGWTADEKTSFGILDAFFDAGFNTIDTADVYSAWVPGNKGGDSEEIIGKWLKQGKIPRQGGHHHQGRLRDGTGQEGAEGAVYPAGGRGVAEAAADRSISISTSRTGRTPRRRMRKRSAPSPS